MPLIELGQKDEERAIALLQYNAKKHCKDVIDRFVKCTTEVFLPIPRITCTEQFKAMQQCITNYTKDEKNAGLEECRSIIVAEKYAKALNTVNK